MIDCHLLEHEARYAKLQNAIFLEGVEVLSAIRSIILLDSMNISEEKFENLLLLVSPNGEPPEY